MLLRVMRPQWFHQLPLGRREGPAFTTGHLWLTQARSSRATAWRRLIQAIPEYEALKRAANPRAKGH